MTISELIVELQALKCEHGDLQVYHADDDLLLRPLLLGLDWDNRLVIQPTCPRPGASEIMDQVMN